MRATSVQPGQKVADPATMVESTPAQTPAAGGPTAVRMIRESPNVTRSIDKASSPLVRPRGALAETSDGELPDNGVVRRSVRKQTRVPKVCSLID